jgi:hypothetical protein
MKGEGLLTVDSQLSVVLLNSSFRKQERWITSKEFLFLCYGKYIGFTRYPDRGRYYGDT